MRTLEQIQKIKQGQSDPYSIRDVVDVDSLYKYYTLNEEQAIQKNTGPKVLKVDPNEKVFEPLITSLKQQVGEFDIRYIHYFDVQTHILYTMTTNLIILIVIKHLQFLCVYTEIVTM